MKERLQELVGDLRTRAESAQKIGIKHSNPADMARCMGKAQAYHHAAEMVGNLIRDLDEKQPAPRQELPGHDTKGE